MVHRLLPPSTGSPFSGLLLAFSALALSGASWAAPEPKHPLPEDPSQTLWVVAVETTLDGSVSEPALGDLELLRKFRRSGEQERFAEVAGRLREGGSQRSAAWRSVLEGRGLEVLASTTFGDFHLVRGERAALSELPGIRSVDAPSYRSPQALNTSTAIGPAGHDHVGASQTFAVNGSGVEVAVLDTGLDLLSGPGGVPHPTFYVGGIAGSTGPGIQGSRILSAAFHGFGAQTPLSIHDQHGHGTRVGSILGGAAWGPPGASDGGAPGVLLRSYRITDANLPGIASTISMANAIQAAMLEPGVRVLNLSFEGDSDPSAPHLNGALEIAANAGVLVVVSAGVTGPGSPFQHGAFNALAVGASFAGKREPYLLPGYSGTATGPLADGRRYPHLLAVGEALTAAQVGNPSAVAQTWGTSGAAALVSGAAALLFDAVSDLDSLEARAILLASSHPVNSGPEAARGYGYLNVPEAIDMAVQGNYLRAFAPPFLRARYRVFVNPGETLSIAMVFNRQSLAGPYAGDLDLLLRSPNGAELLADRALLDNHSVLRYTSVQGGLYELEVENLWHPSNPALLPMEYALAGVNAVPMVDIDPCVFGPAKIDAVSPQPFAASTTGGEYLKITGCNLSAVEQVSVAGILLDLVSAGPRQVVARAAGGLPSGNFALELSGPGISLSVPLAIGPTASFLELSPNFGGTAGGFTVPLFSNQFGTRLVGKPGDLFAVLLSTQTGAFVLPGVPELSVAPGVGGLILWQVGAIPSIGVSLQFLPNGVLPPSLQPGFTIHGQAVVADMGAQGFPIQVTNTSKGVYLGP